MKILIPTFVLTIGLLIGCADSGKSSFGRDKQKVTQQWNTARANVMGGLAKNQYETGNFDRCRITVNEALKLEPTSAPLHVLSAKLYIEQGQLEAAERELQNARQCDPKNAEAAYLSGVVFQRWQKLPTAYDFYNQACEKAPAELSYVLAKAEILVAMNREKEALTLLEEKAAYFEHSGAIRDAIGQLLMQQGRYSKAAENFRQASILQSDELSFREHLGLALYFSGQYRESTDVLGKLVKDEPYDKRADLWTALGECQMQTGRPLEARGSFETASQLDPSAAQIWLGQGKAALELNDLKRAELSLKKSLSLEPESSESTLMLGYLRLRQNRLDEAMTAFRKANSLDRTDTVSLCMIGYVLEKKGQSEQAAKVYAQALKIKPDDDMAQKLMASLDMRE